MIKIKKTWQDAHSYCRSTYTDLASIRSPWEQNQVNNVISRSDSVWIGLFLDNWQWSDQWSRRFRTWESGPLSVGSGDCAAVVAGNSGKWSNDSCTTLHPFVCYGASPLQTVSRLYHAVRYLKTWPDAQRYCRARFTDLATVDSVNDVYSVKNQVDLSYTGLLWVGIQRSVSTNWSWSMGDESQANYFNWAAGNPSGSGQCVSNTNAVWSNTDCQTLLYFVCFSESTGYIMVIINKTWQDAQSYCRSTYTDLARIRSPWEQTQVNNVVRRWVSVWIGLFLDNWQWSDQWSRRFRNWALGPPSDGTGDCAAVVAGNYGRWMSDSCTTLHPFVCYGAPSLRPAPGLYHAVNVLKTWPDAQRYCREKFTDLATVDSVDDVYSVMNQVDFTYSGLLWIGLQRPINNLWWWSLGDEPLSDYFNWATGNPSGIGQCVSNMNGFWNDTDCQTPLYFACYSEGTGYIMVSIKKTWQDAQSYCRSTYTDLASIRSPWEQNQLNNVVSRSDSVWIGLFLDNWQWSDQWNRRFRNWESGPLSVGSGDCAAVVAGNSGKWSNDSCTTLHPFVCYGAPPFQPVSRLYHAVRHLKTWPDAQRYCRARFTDLATVDSVNDVYSVRNQVDLSYTGLLWVGLQRAVSTNWSWSMGDESLANYFNWATGNPSGSGQCVSNMNAVWSDIDCQTLLYFVCFSGELSNKGTGYIMVLIKKTWQSAQSYCRSTYTDLASIRSPWEQTQVNNVVGSRIFVWIGLFLDNWQWSDQWSRHFRNWALGPPSVGTGDCAAVVAGKYGRWMNDNCTTLH
ncbi:hypothetical protein HF521_009694, partial [Silurus meridionalis]